RRAGPIPCCAAPSAACVQGVSRYCSGPVAGTWFAIELSDSPIARLFRAMFCFVCRPIAFCASRHDSISLPRIQEILPMPTPHLLSPRGFRAAGVYAGLKRRHRPDLGLLVCDTLATAAAVFTTN